ncbi:9775_t:CDS:1, partial [Dentiscutata heterogama]
PSFLQSSLEQTSMFMQFHNEPCTTCTNIVTKFMCNIDRETLRIKLSVRHYPVITGLYIEWDLFKLVMVILCRMRCCAISISNPAISIVSDFYILTLT